jgi:hypothetical protein
MRSALLAGRLDGVFTALCKSNWWAGLGLFPKGRLSQTRQEANSQSQDREAFQSLDGLTLEKVRGVKALLFRGLRTRARMGP